MQFCLVHKIDRLARSRADDVQIQQGLLSAGVTLEEGPDHLAVAGLDVVYSTDGMSEEEEQALSAA